MLYSILAHSIMVLHFAFTIFVAIGALLAWRWPVLVRLHLPAVGWAFVTVVLGFPCPLTPLEKNLRRLAGDQGYLGGFIDHYIEGVIYPDKYSFAIRSVATTTIAVGYVVIVRRARATRQATALCADEIRISRSC